MLKKIIFFAFSLAPMLNGYAHDYRTKTYYEVVERPRQVCWNETVSRHSGDYTGVILGGLAGGILGNQVGKGNGRVIATALGATTGAVIGDNLSERRQRYRTEQRCKTVMEQVRIPVTRKIPVEPEVIYVNQRQTVATQPVYLINQERERPNDYREYRHHRHHNHGHHRGHHYGWYE